MSEAMKKLLDQLVDSIPSRVSVFSLISREKGIVPNTPVDVEKEAEAIDNWATNLPQTIGKEYIMTLSEEEQERLILRKPLPDVQLPKDEDIDQGADS